MFLTTQRQQLGMTAIICSWKKADVSLVQRCKFPFGDVSGRNDAIIFSLIHSYFIYFVLFLHMVSLLPGAGQKNLYHLPHSKYWQGLLQVQVANLSIFTFTLFSDNKSSNTYSDKINYHHLKVTVTQYILVFFLIHSFKLNNIWAALQLKEWSHGYKDQKQLKWQWQIWFGASHNCHTKLKQNTY